MQAVLTQCDAKQNIDILTHKFIAQYLALFFYL